MQFSAFEKKKTFIPNVIASFEFLCGLINFDFNCIHKESVQRMYSGYFCMLCYCSCTMTLCSLYQNMLIFQFRFAIRFSFPVLIQSFNYYECRHDCFFFFSVLVYLYQYMVKLPFYTGCILNC